ncbi:hypothetical protein N7497_011974 [Penicillium chrysogenum]|uniref:Uncharacterized protein n=1 Tax=Penicillium chrysogenum TaxID=5076 RepID=A0ABQ8WTB5_PENCH|nr:hypothetical protein N7505_000141 [Penicillium chrysogenum]KAJ6141081.1 hypothetical protein N7497_011974 [Penicillium chrysogenum]
MIREPASARRVFDPLDTKHSLSQVQQPGAKPQDPNPWPQDAAQVIPIKLEEDAPAQCLGRSDLIFCQQGFSAPDATP